MHKKLICPAIFGERIEIYRSIDSTQKRVRDIFNDNPVESIVFADHQTAGVGRRGREWVSPEGGLYFSLLLNPEGKKEIFSMLALLWALRSLKEEGMEDIGWKWPNDIMYDERKAGGIITELLPGGWIALGIGINAGLNENQFPGSLDDTVSVIDIDRKNFVDRFLRYIDGYKGKDGLSENDIGFLDPLHILKDSLIRAGDDEGMVSGIAPDGSLEIVTSGRKKNITTGPVFKVDNKDFTDINIIAIDIGNTSTRVGYIENGDITASDIPTKPVEDFPQRLISGIRDKYGDIIGKIDGIAVSCVVSLLETKVLERLKKELHPYVVNVTCELSTGLTLKVKEPAQLGADRICNAVAVNRLYGGDTVLVDLGTANTYDVVSRTGEYIGGVIAPGIDSMKEALVRRADKLKDHEFTMPDTSIGDETVISQNIGLFHTLNGQIKSIINAIKRDWQREFRIIFTGGGISMVDKEILANYTTDRDITIKGLAVIFKLQNKLQNKLDKK
ncbi:MAG: biotin--[acetyl-CoA-carboxylase] ligase [Elusimicrobiota bacterium]